MKTILRLNAISSASACFGFSVDTGEVSKYITVMYTVTFYPAIAIIFPQLNIERKNKQNYIVNKQSFSIILGNGYTDS